MTASWQSQAQARPGIRVGGTSLWRVVAASAVFGAVYGLAVVAATEHVFSPIALIDGAAIGAVTALLCRGFDALLQSGRWGEMLRHEPLLVLIAVKTLWYGASIVLALYVANVVLDPEPWALDEPRFYVSVAISLLVALVFSLTANMRRLLGPRVLGNLMVGRYAQPREEDRIFLFVDLVGSTQIAERIGPTAFLALLDRFVSDLTPPILASDGEIYRYVGDEVIVTWPLERGARSAGCIACVIAMRERMAQQAPVYQREFGVAPQFRAALHAGRVVAGEMGDAKREIVFLGDAVNTTARIEQACRDTGAWALISDVLLRQLVLPEGVAMRPLGLVALKGKAEALALHALG
jgi:adenylate cyclase